MPESCRTTTATGFQSSIQPRKTSSADRKTEEALSDLDKATSLKPQHAGAHEYFAEALEKSGKEIEAAIHYRIAEELRKKKK